jgi:ABC-type Fe3+/spermidine/putrescine transport system ATPase subunit
MNDNITTNNEDVLSVKGVSLSLGGHTVLSDISFEVKKGELVAVVGPSGSGKSSLLNLIAGFFKPSLGEIEIAHRVVSNPNHSLPPEKRNIGMVFQSHALLSQLRVWQNVSFPLERQGKPKKAAYEKAVTTLKAMGMDKFLDRYPDELSGGQQQRVGLARALTANASLYLFDEPTANLDAKNRQSFSHEVRRKQQQAGIACLYVTHHIEEAFEIADRVLVLINGSIKQIGAPEDIYEQPNSPEVASLGGKFFTIPATVNRMVEKGLADVSIGQVNHSMDLAAANEGTNGRVQILCRPEWCTTQSSGIEGTIELIRYQGPTTEYDVQTPVGKIIIRELGRQKYEVGDALHWLPLKGLVI